MRISSSMPAADLSTLPVEDQIDAEILRKEKEQLEVDGSMTVRLIESAAASLPGQLENKPLNFGSVGRRINIAV
jgi:hypothetical protein